MTEAPTVPPIVPHLCVVGARDAIAFYEKAFAATVAEQMPAEDGKRLIHADLAVFGSHVYLHDDFPEYYAPGRPVSPQHIGGSAVTITVNFATAAEVDATYHRAMESGATSVTVPEDMFWGARYARIADPFGHLWAFNAQNGG